MLMPFVQGRGHRNEVTPEQLVAQGEHPMAIREDRTKVLAFSQGPRIRPGANLSRLEQQIAWNRLLDRPDLHAHEISLLESFSVRSAGAPEAGA